jgi:hypothetical protein
VGDDLMHAIYMYTVRACKQLVRHSNQLLLCICMHICMHTSQVALKAKQLCRAEVLTAHLGLDL